MSKNNLTETVHALSFAGKKRLKLFLELSDEARAQALFHLSKYLQRALMADLQDIQLVNVLSQFDPDEVTDLVQLLPKGRRERIIKQLTSYLQNSVTILSKFSPESAAGLMNLDYIQVDCDDTIAKVSTQFRTHENRTGRLSTIFVMERGVLKGYIPGHKLGFARSSDKVHKYLRKAVTIEHNASHDDVVRLFRLHPHSKVAVLGEKRNIIGVIYSDDVLRVIKEEKASELYNFAGLHEEESVMDQTFQKVRHRYKWLIVNLATAFLASFTVGLFDELIAKYVLLAVYMPIVAGMGGNAGTQTLAVIVRGIALKQITLQYALPTLKKEMYAGIINGTINGILVACIVMFINQDIKIAFILGIAMIVNLFIAGTFGTLIPLVMYKLGKDPATSATIFITTTTDVLGFLVFLGLATVLLQ